MSAVLSVEQLYKTYGDQAVVAGISLSIMSGECFGLLGPNGAGKTTTLRLCLGLSKPDHGEIRLRGFPVPRQAREARMKVGVVPQMDNLDPDFTASENLLVYGRYFGLSDKAIKARIPDLLEFAGLTQRAHAKMSELSGGMKRRLTMARALVNDPDVLFLDEPTTGLDPQARHLIWDRMKKLMAQGKTLLLTTHFMDEAERLCTRLAVMDQGRIVTEGSPRDLIAAHIEPEVVEVYGEGLAAWLDAHGARRATRFEVSGETAFCYVHDATALLETLQSEPHLRYLHRPANLEDVFMKLTGRDLRD